jgi:hypothetical protein
MVRRGKPWLVRATGGAAACLEAVSLVGATVSLARQGDVGGWGLGGWVVLACLQTVVALVHSATAFWLALYAPPEAEANRARETARLTAFALQVPLAAFVRLVLISAYYASRQGLGAGLDSPQWAAVTGVVLCFSLLCLHSWVEAEGVLQSRVFERALAARTKVEPVPPAAPGEDKAPPATATAWG